MKRWLDLWRDFVTGYRRPLLALTIVLLLVALFDFIGRIYVPRDASLRVFTAPRAVKIPEFIDTAKVLASLETWLPSQAVVEPPKEKEISLQGIFSSRGAGVAAVVLRDPTSGAMQSMRVAAGQEVEGWRVELISPRKVMLRKGDQVRELVLFRAPTE